MRTVAICDVGPRDGLQNEPALLAPAVRAELVNRLTRTGVARVEAASFVRDDLVPRMAGAEETVALLEPLDALIAVATWLEGVLGHPLPGRVHRAGRLPASLL